MTKSKSRLDNEAKEIRASKVRRKLAKEELKARETEDELRAAYSGVVER